MSHASVIPGGDPIVADAALESIVMQPVSMAPGVVVVTLGRVPFVPDRPLAVFAAPSRGVTGSTPEYRAMPPPLVTAELSVQA
jgi:hypothetical protein